MLVIPEDFRKDQYVLEPLVRALMAEAGRPRAKVEVCKDPLLGGLSAALDPARLAEVIERYPMVDLFLLVVDRDGEPGRRDALDRVERESAARLAARQGFIGECAWQELEVWLLAGHELPAAWTWAEVRAEPHAKERFFEPFARQCGVVEHPGEGRKTLAREAASRYARVRQLCPEDVQRLEERVRAFVETPRG